MSFNEVDIEKRNRVDKLGVSVIDTWRIGADVIIAKNNEKNS